MKTTIVIDDRYARGVVVRFIRGKRVVDCPTVHNEQADFWRAFTRMMFPTRRRR